MGYNSHMNYKGLLALKPHKTSIAVGERRFDCFRPKKILPSLLIISILMTYNHSNPRFSPIISVTVLLRTRKANGLVFRRLNLRDLVLTTISGPVDKVY